MPGENPLINLAKSTIASWTSDRPPELALAVADLGRRVCEHGELPNDDADWAGLLDSFDVQRGQSVRDAILYWDNWVAEAEVDTTNRVSYIKLGILTWTVKMLLKKFGMLSGSEPIDDFDAWKQQLCDNLDKYILVGDE